MNEMFRAWLGAVWRGLVRCGKVRPGGAWLGKVWQGVFLIAIMFRARLDMVG